MDTIKYIAGVGQDSPEDLAERIRVIEDKVQRDAREIVEVLKLDFPAFVERQAKERYTHAPHGFTLSKDELRAAKAAVAEAGRKAAAEIIPDLESPALWLDDRVRVPPVGERRELRAHAGAHTIIQRIGGYLREALAASGFPNLDEVDFADLYRLPTWFISGRLLVSLVESYWRNLEEWQALKQTLGAMRDQTGRAQRADDWDEA